MNENEKAESEPRMGDSQWDKSEKQKGGENESEDDHKKEQKW